MTTADAQASLDLDRPNAALRACGHAMGATETVAGELEYRPEPVMSTMLNLHTFHSRSILRQAAEPELPRRWLSDSSIECLASSTRRNKASEGSVNIDRGYRKISALVNPQALSCPRRTGPLSQFPGVSLQLTGRFVHMVIKGGSTPVKSSERSPHLTSPRLISPHFTSSLPRLTSIELCATFHQRLSTSNRPRYLTCQNTYISVATSTMQAQGSPPCAGPAFASVNRSKSKLGSGNDGRQPDTRTAAPDRRELSETTRVSPSRSAATHLHTDGGAVTVRPGGSLSSRAVKELHLPHRRSDTRVATTGGLAVVSVGGALRHDERGRHPVAHGQCWWFCVTTTDSCNGRRWWHGCTKAIENKLILPTNDQAKWEMMLVLEPGWWNSGMDRHHWATSPTPLQLPCPSSGTCRASG
ncbi:hypothetical protein B0J13DRAFT_605335 [Dactylonectria estremocensis]|uniref:Uncharacterized protein n=1 Tax=Dactylonectria estremocensis TaxID=1079267 RepID=A0A9P9F4Z2_9HYPO|nr:hypothetical protein B0J13DRAFT_605335 [Dactylonectria estremocensis]